MITNKTEQHQKQGISPGLSETWEETGQTGVGGKMSCSSINFRPLLTQEGCLKRRMGRRMLKYFNGYFSCNRIFGEIGYFFEKERVRQHGLDIPDYVKDITTLYGYKELGKNDFNLFLDGFFG